jgi:hypothetical protein
MQFVHLVLQDFHGLRIGLHLLARVAGETALLPAAFASRE